MLITCSASNNLEAKVYTRVYILFLIYFHVYVSNSNKITFLRDLCRRSGYWIRGTWKLWRGLRWITTSVRSFLFTRNQQPTSPDSIRATGVKRDSTSLGSGLGVVCTLATGNLGQLELSINISGNFDWCGPAPSISVPKAIYQHQLAMNWTAENCLLNAPLVCLHDLIIPWFPRTCCNTICRRLDFGWSDSFHR